MATIHLHPWARPKPEPFAILDDYKDGSIALYTLPPALAKGEIDVSKLIEFLRRIASLSPFKCVVVTPEMAEYIFLNAPADTSEAEH